MANQGKVLTELDDPRLAELREKVKQCKPHVPKPGDPDYLTPEQIEWIKAGADDDD
jgi:hypothetical protein